MAPKKKATVPAAPPSRPWSTLDRGDTVVYGGVSRTLKDAVDPVLDPRGGVNLDTLPREWYVTFTDGTSALVSGSVETP